MRLTSYFNARPNKSKIPFAIVLLALCILACSTSSLPRPRSLFSTATPTPTESAGEIQLEVTVVYLTTGQGSIIGSEQLATPAPTATILSLVDATPSTLPPTDTPVFKATSTLTPTNTPISPTPTSQPTLTATNTITLTTTPTPTQIVSSSGPEIRGAIALERPEEGLSVPASVGGLEFKWRWAGEGLGCRLPEGFGFELRIWPAVTGCGPLGVMDATKSQVDVFCDPETGLRSYMVVDLKGTPGVKATGAGKFLWDVAYVQLEPYQPLIAAPSPRMFEISLAYGGPLDPFGEKLSCSNFSAWAEAQAVFQAAGGPAQDPHSLDPDKNGSACDELLSPGNCSSDICIEQ